MLDLPLAIAIVSTVVGLAALAYLVAWAWRNL